jgi:hypothetical protein
VEEARTNVWTRSEEFDNAAWDKNNVTVTANAATAPDGTLTADKLIASATTAVHSLSRIKTIVSPSWTTIYVKAAEYTICDIYDLNVDCGFRVNLSTGALSESPAFAGKFRAGQYGIDSVNNGWYRIRLGFASSDATVNNPVRIYPNDGQSFTGDGTSGIYIWGAQLEAGSFPTSYIPTTSATVTRAADIASITGANFSSWYNANAGTLLAYQRSLAGQDAYQTATFGLSSNNTAAQFIAIEATNDYNRFYVYGNGNTAINYIYAPVTPGTLTKDALAYANNNVAAVRNGGTVAIDTSVGIPIASIDRAGLGHDVGFGLQKQKTIARLAYYPVRLSNATLQALTTYGVVSSFPYSFSIKGRDILALKEVNKTSTRDFIFIKGLLSKAQPRLTTALQYTASGVALRNAAMLKVAPTTIGNYFFSSGLTLSGATVQINGTNARSIATSPFSSSTATVPLLFAGLRPQANWRITEPMASGTVTSPESAIPIETSDFLLFIKAGQS